jgi:branched-chain amino acid transport system permease protein
LIGAIVLVLLVPFFIASSPYWLFIIITAGLFLIACLGLNLQLGSAGMVNLASAAFYAVGAYAAGMLALHWGWPAWLNLLAGALVAGAFSLLLFVPVLKTKGHYLALVTIAFQFMVVILLDNMEWTGGPQGLKNIPLFSFAGYSFNSDINLGFIKLPGYANFYYLLVLIIAAVVVASQRIYNSWVGVTLSTIRDDEIAAQTFGVRVNRWKLVIFFLGNCFIGLAGAYYSHLVGFISPPNFHFDKSLIMVSIVILGGMDNVTGVILGSLLLIILPEKLRVVQEYRFLIYGMVLIVMLIFRPRGLLPFQPRDFLDLIRNGRAKRPVAVGGESAEGGA